jgi:hypothetical protein
MTVFRVLASAVAAACLSMTAAQAQPNADREGLARELLDVLSPTANQANLVDAEVIILQGLATAAPQPAGTAPLLDKAQLATSLRAGVLASRDETRKFQANAYATALSADDLRAIVAFYRSPYGQVAISEKAAHLAQVMMVGRIAPSSPNTSEPYAIPTYLPKAAELGFLASKAGKAVDYCARLTCSDAQRGVFTTMGMMVSGQAPKSTP